MDADSEELIERLGEAGCDDALVGVGRPGRIALEVSRESDSAEKAIGAALADVSNALPTAMLIEVSPDLVGLTDIAERVGISRQAIRKLMVTHRETFPTPVHEGSASIWHLADVLAWLDEKGGHQIDRRVVEVARVALEVNLAKEAHRYAATGTGKQYGFAPLRVRGGVVTNEPIGRMRDGE